MTANLHPFPVVAFSVCRPSASESKMHCGESFPFHYDTKRVDGAQNGNDEPSFPHFHTTAAPSKQFTSPHVCFASTAGVFE